MSLTIYHNPRCSKSRKTLEIIENAGLTPRIVKYLETPPTGEQILRLGKLLGLSVAELLRRGEAVVAEAGDLPALDDEAALAEWMAAHPVSLERPVVVDNERDRAVIGRPPENVLKLIDS